MSRWALAKTLQLKDSQVLQSDSLNFSVPQLLHM